LYEKIALIQAWQAVDRLIAAVTHEVNKRKVSDENIERNRQAEFCNDSASAQAIHDIDTELEQYLN
jgi:hypothetical protein